MSVVVSYFAEQGITSGSHSGWVLEMDQAETSVDHDPDSPALRSGGVVVTGTATRESGTSVTAVPE